MKEVCIYIWIMEERYWNWMESVKCVQYDDGNGRIGKKRMDVVMLGEWSVKEVEWMRVL